MPSLRRSSIVCAFVLLFDAAAARAIHAETSLANGNGSGINTRLFRAAVDSKGFFTVDGADVMGAKEFAFGLVLDGGRGLLRLRDVGADGNPRSPSRVLDEQLHAVLFIDYSPLKNLVVGVGIPTDLVSGAALNRGSSIAGVTSDARKTDVNAFVDGAWQLNVKYRLLRPDHGLGVALIGAVDLPASSDARMGYAADPGLSFHPSVAFEQRFGASERFRIGASIGASLTTGDGSRIGDLSAGDAGKTLKHGSLGRAGVAIGYRVSEALDLVAETYGSQLLKNDAGGTAGTSGEVVGGVKVFVEENSYLFLGGGAGYLKGYQAADERIFLGFVFEPSVGDRDHDGIKDDDDRCPDAPEDKDGFQDEDGCPDPDNDGDHFLDKDDPCPNQAEDYDDFEDQDGCPDGKKEHDALVDVTTPPDTDTPPSIVLLENIQFDYDSAKIQEGSLKIVDAVAKVLADHPDFMLVEVQGHADERGDDLYNLKLTQLRVESVVKALVARGVESARLRAQGYGEYCPLDQAHTKEAWEKNRRVEFKILKTKDGPTGVELGCAAAEAHGVHPAPVK